MAFGDVMWANLGEPDGHPQAGTRPSIFIQAADDDQLSTRVVVPVSGNLDNLQFPTTIRVEPSATNGLTEPSVLLVFSIAAVDKSKVGGRKGTLEPDVIAALKQMLREFLDLA